MLAGLSVVGAGIGLMSSTPPTPTGHPVLGTVAQLHKTLDRTKDVPVWSLTAEQTAAAVADLARAEARVAALKARLLAHGARVEVRSVNASPTIEAWLAYETHVTKGQAGEQVRLAEALDERWQHLAKALSKGKANLEQARVIARALDQLPDSIEPAVVRKAEKYLVKACRQLRPARAARHGQARPRRRRPRGG